ncbi:MAG: hypothetical protein HY595_06135 [Candidatus Omnitrophica bacterium]|nr:hypothetical protein [Candidatus Omnitrophota bacterium]
MRSRWTNNGAVLRGMITLLCWGAWPGAVEVRAEEKQTDVEYFYLTRPSKLGVVLDPSRFHDRVIVNSQNFAIYYRKDHISPSVAVEVARQLESAWNAIVGLGYQVPEAFTTYRVPVYLLNTTHPTNLAEASYLRSVRIPGTTTDVYRWLDAIEVYGPWDDFNWFERKSSLAHELFHIFQYGYAFRDGVTNAVADQSLWFSEGTAVWIEDEIFPEVGDDYGYMGYQADWRPMWMELNPSLYETSRPGAFSSFEYGTGLFFKYLSEHAPAKRDAIRKIWEAYAPPNFQGEYGIRAVHDALRPPHQYQPNPFYHLFTDFCVAVYTRNLQPYGFGRGHGMLQILRIPKSSRSEAWVYRAYAQRGVQITPAVVHPMRPLSALYYAFKPPAADDLQLKPSRLHVVVRVNPKSLVRAAAVKEWGPATNNRVEVEHLAFAADGKSTLTIPSYGLQPNAINRVVLVLANPWLDPDRVELAAAVGEPPYLKELKIFRGPQREWIYYGVWGESLGLRTRSVWSQLSLEHGEEEIQDVEVEATFSRGMDHVTNAQIGRVSVPWQGQPTMGRTQWRGTISRLKLDPLSKQQGYLEIKVVGEAPERLDLDANPETVASLNPTTLQWDGYEAQQGGSDTHFGGVDERHQIMLKKYAPFVKAVSMVQGNTPVYEAAWRDEGREVRNLYKDLDEVVALDQARSGKVVIEFSKPMKTAELRIEQTQIPLRGVKGGRRFEGAVDFRPFRRVQREALQLSITATDGFGDHLDSQPESVADFYITQQPRKTRWLRYTPGTDRWHRLRAKREESPAGISLAGRWQWDEGVMEISQAGARVNSVWVTLEPVFKSGYGFREGDPGLAGTFRDRAYRGKINTHFSVGVKAMCPAQWQMWAKCEATLSADGQTLEGRWIDYELGDRCRLKRTGWRPFIARRLPEEKSTGTQDEKSEKQQAETPPIPCEPGVSYGYEVESGSLGGIQTIYLVTTHYEEQQEEGGGCRVRIRKERALVEYAAAIDLDTAARSRRWQVGQKNTVLLDENRSSRTDAVGFQKLQQDWSAWKAAHMGKRPKEQREEADRRIEELVTAIQNALRQ